MNRTRVASLTALTLLSLQGCSLIIDTNPDGVIRDAKTGGGGGKTTGTSTNVGTGQNGGTTPGGTGNTTTVSGGSAGTATSEGGSAGIGTNPAGGGPIGGAIGTGGSGNVGTSVGGVGGTTASGGTGNGPAGGQVGAGGTTTLGGTTNLGGATSVGGTTTKGGATSGGATSLGGTATGGATTVSSGGVVGTAGGTTSTTGGVATGGSATGGNQGTGGLVCSSGTPCGSSCVNLQTDASNCGACGHSCRYSASTCVGGKCQPVTLATFAPQNVGGITQDSDYIYWSMYPTSDAGTVMRIAKSGTMDPAVPQVLAVTGSQPRGPIIVNNVLQWSYSTDGSGSLGGFTYLALSPLGTAKDANISIDGYVDAVIADESTSYFSAAVTSGFYIGKTVPGSATAVALCGVGTANCKVDEVVSIGVDTTNVYWTDLYGKLWKLPLAGGPSVLLASWPTATQGTVGGISAYGNTLYCSVGSTLYRVAVDGLSSPVPATLNPTLGGAYRIDATGFYWVGTDNSLWLQPTGQVTPVQLVTSTVGGGIGVFLFDATRIYWLTRQLGAIMAVAR